MKGGYPTPRRECDFGKLSWGEKNSKFLTQLEANQLRIHIEDILIKINHEPL